MRVRGTSIHWKIWPLVALFVVLVCAMILLSFYVNEQVYQEVYPFITTETKIIIPKYIQKPDFPNPGHIAFNRNAHAPDGSKIGFDKQRGTPGYKIWEEPDTEKGREGPGENGQPVQSFPEELPRLQSTHPFLFMNIINRNG